MQFKLFLKQDEPTNLNADIANTLDFKSLKFKAELVENTFANPTIAANGILNNTTIAVPLKNLRNIWRSLETPLINSKVELKFRWIKHLCFDCRWH